MSQDTSVRKRHDAYMEELRVTHARCKPEGPGCGYHTCHDCYLDGPTLGAVGASAGNPVGPRSDVYDAAQEAGSRPESERSERALMRTSGGSRLTQADSMGPAGAPITPTAQYSFGVRPGGSFMVYDQHAHFTVINYGNKLLCLDLDVFNQCGLCGRDVSSCTCDFGV